MAGTSPPRDVAEVFIWGSRVGAVAWNPAKNTAAFEYDDQWLRAGPELSPFILPHRSGVTTFPELAATSFRGLPGLLADSVPGRFGQRVITQWLRHRNDDSPLTPVGQLRLVGSAGRGALEFRPATSANRSAPDVQLDRLPNSVQAIQGGGESPAGLDKERLVELVVAAAATGGREAKATIELDRQPKKVHPWQDRGWEGSESWLVKFYSGGSRGRVEYAYSLMAADAGIDVPRCRLLTDGSGRAHFATRRFDRGTDGKPHVQSLAALRHFDPDEPGVHSYEEALSSAQALGVGASGVSQLYRRMVFNVVAANRNDTTQKVAFAMNRAEEWRLAPAFDLTSASRPHGHQMTVNGRTNDITTHDLQEVGRRFRVRDHARTIDAVMSTVAAWGDYAAYAQVPPDMQRDIGSTHQIGL